MKKILYILILLPALITSQNQIKGVVFEANNTNEEIPLPGANVHWLGTSVGAVTDIDGKFNIDYKTEYRKLIISYVGFTTDTLTNN